MASSSGCFFQRPPPGLTGKHQSDAVFSSTTKVARHQASEDFDLDMKKRVFSPYGCGSNGYRVPKKPRFGKRGNRPKPAVRGWHRFDPRHIWD